MRRFSGALLLTLLTIPLMITCAYLAEEFDIDRRMRDEGSRFARMAFMPLFMLTICVWVTIVWAPLVRWTRKRILMNVLLLIASGAVGIGLACQAVGDPAELRSYEWDDFGAFLGLGLLITYLLGSVVVWPSRRGDHLARLAASNLGERLSGLVACPSCGADMTRLQRLVCDGCGASFTVDVLLGHHASSTASESPADSVTACEAATPDESDNAGDAS